MKGKAKPTKSTTERSPETGHATKNGSAKNPKDLWPKYRRKGK